jgi:LacI family transcriptional regulator
MVGKRRPARPTMKDIADRVGISFKSVSRVLNGEPGVSADTAEQVLTAVQELGFRRNDLARSLRRRDRTETVGVVVKHVSTRFFDGLIRGIDEVAAEHGALVLTAATRTSDREKSTVLAMSSRRVDGLVIALSSDDQTFLRAEQAAGLPLVFVDQRPTGISADTVIVDNAGGAYGATKHLLSHGHRRIGVVGPEANAFTVSERVNGYRTALAEALPSADGPVRLDCDGPAEARQAASELLRLPEPPTAFFCLNNRCTIGTARAVREASLSHEVALVGFDDFETADLLDPPVTVVAQDVEAMGRRAAQLLFARIKGHDGPPETTVLPTYLIERGSGELKCGRRKTRVRARVHPA